MKAHVVLSSSIASKKTQSDLHQFIQGQLQIKLISVKFININHIQVQSKRYIFCNIFGPWFGILSDVRACTIDNGYIVRHLKRFYS